MPHFFGLLYVIMASRENFFCWFAGIVNVSIYIFIFSQRKNICKYVFANCLFIIEFLWLILLENSKKKGHQSKISKMDGSYRYFLILLFILLMGGIYLALQNSSSNLIMLDTITTAAGLIATWMQARKFIENWIIWIPTDIILAVYVFNRRALCEYDTLPNIHSNSNIRILQMETRTKFEDCKMIKRIAITGPESTGKSWLTEHLALQFNTVFVTEYAREYIDSLNRPYTFEDIEVIAKHQLALEENVLAKANDVLFVDTDFFVTKIWSDFVYHKCCPWDTQSAAKSSLRFTFAV